MRVDRTEPTRSGVIVAILGADTVHWLEVLREFLLFQKTPAPNRTTARMIPAITNSTVMTVSRLILLPTSRTNSTIRHQFTVQAEFSWAKGESRVSPTPTEKKVHLLCPQTSYCSKRLNRQMQTFASHRMVSVPLIFRYFPVPPVIAPTENPMTGANPFSSGNGACP